MLLNEYNAEAQNPRPEHIPKGLPFNLWFKIQRKTLLALENTTLSVCLTSRSIIRKPSLTPFSGRQALKGSFQAACPA